MIRAIDWESVKDAFDATSYKPFSHVVIDNFFLPEVADKLSSEFPDYNRKDNVEYKSAIEDKKASNRWDMFPATTYRAFDYFGSVLTEHFRMMVNNYDLRFDYGLHGGGWHMHGRGGNNNLHLDYNLHPKLPGWQRKLNIIVYLTPEWDASWNGGLEIWSGVENSPLNFEKYVDNRYNRAIIFDTTQNSWHGLPEKITCPEGVVRKSLAGYYLIPAPANTEERYRALFAPRKDQMGDTTVADLIAKRANPNHNVYKQS
jgi:2OG-Fe(II) oxygenase superfamily